MCWKSFKKVYRRIFFLIAVFWKPALEITKRAQHCVLQRLLERIKPFRKYPKSSKFVCIKSSLRCLHNLCPFCRNSKISRSSSHRFLRSFAQQKTFIQGIRSVKHFKRKCRIGLKFDLELKPLWRHCQVTFIPIAQKLISWLSSV